MKVVSKPISSPSRTEKFPPPLMRFLRSNGGSKSRGRSRSSPMFVRKKNAVIETQEPSSPKVTCIGQVRVRRSSNQFSRSKSGLSKVPPAKCPSFWFPKNLFCILRKPKFRSFRPVRRKWVSFFRCGYCRKVNFRTDSSKLESNRRSHFEDSETEKNGDEDEEAQVEEATEVFISSTPPKNAFLLTRCRSAPYRSSSLASRFWGSPQASFEETEEDEKEAKERSDFEEPERETERPLTSESEPNSSSSLVESRNDEESEEILGNPKQFEGRNSEGSSQETKGNAALPLILTRCKSEPAKTGERLINPENHQFLEPNKVGFC